MPSVQFVLGDTVTWSSQAGAYRKTKTGVIAEVLPPGARPDRVRFPKLYRYSYSECGYGRRETSYVVQVGRKAYWPRVAHLHRVAGDDSDPVNAPGQRR